MSTDGPESRDWDVSEKYEPGRELERLYYLSNRLRLIGLMVPVLTVTNLSLSLLGWVALRVELLATDVLLVITALSATFTLLSVIMLVVFDSARKRGDALFAEISDELQWHVRQAKGPHVEQPDDRPPFEMRVALRRFAYASDLPLIPGRLGPATYTLVNCAITVLSILSFPGISPYR